MIKEHLDNPEAVPWFPQDSGPGQVQTTRFSPTGSELDSVTWLHGPVYRARKEFADIAFT